MGSEQTVIRITVEPPQPDSRYGLTIESDYSEAFVAALREAIPPRERWWDVDGRCWKVAPAHLDTVTALATQHFDRAWLIRGAEREDLHTGVVHAQLSLFG